MSYQRMPWSFGLRRQRGAAFLILVMMLAIAAVSFIVFAAPSESNQLAAARKTAQALAAAREALIGFAASVPDSDRPGDLPCPATDYATGDAGSTCSTAASRIGYLPWRKLGLPDLRDGSGAPLLYAVSNGFKNSPRTGTLNSDTAGDFTVAGENAIAVVFAPGSPIGSQNRNAGVFNVANFLELGNADGDSVFDNSAETATFNDRLLWITPRAFFPPLELRALRLTQERLLDYFNDNGRFPSADQYLVGTPCQTFSGGRVPYYGSSCLSAGAWTLPWPSWYWDNYWDYVIHYAPAQRCVTGTACSGIGSYLTVDTQNNVRALLIRQGIRNGQTRPCTLPSQCLDDTENGNGNTIYITPVAGNDRLTIVSP
jgi:hypothetical protein